MKRDAKLKRIQKISLDILKEIIRVCDENNIDYQLCRGSLLGAIRHKGIIPWDDDIDISMKRKDFDRFLEIAPSKLPMEMEVLSYKSEKVYPFVFAKVFNKNTSVVEHYLESSGYRSGVYVDIFPIDGTPNNRILRRLHIGKVSFYENALTLSYLDENRHKEWWKKLLIKVGKKVINKEKTHKKVQNLLRKYDLEKSELVTIMGRRRSELLMPKWIFETRMVDFEGMKVKGTKEFDLYLSKLYGDYMKIPDVENQIQHMSYMDFNL